MLPTNTKELEELSDYYTKLHYQAVRAYRTDNVDMWDKKAQEYMKKLMEIELLINETI